MRTVNFIISVLAAVQTTAGQTAVVLFSVDGADALEMTRADLTDDVCRAIELPLKESDIVVRTILDSIVRALRAGDTVEIRGFGRFHTRQRRARQRLVALIHALPQKPGSGAARRWPKCGHESEATWNWNPQTQAPLWGVIQPLALQS